MNALSTVPYEETRDPWRDACGASVIASFLLIVVHVAGPKFLGLQFSYAGGGAAVLGVGAMLGLGLHERAIRLSLATAMIGLLSLRFVSGLRPDLLLAANGELTFFDGLGLAVLILQGAWMLHVALMRRPLERNGVSG